MNEQRPVEKKPGPSRRAIIGWTVAMLTVLALSWTGGTLVVSARRVHKALELPVIIYISSEAEWPQEYRARAMASLGGADRAFGPLRLYARLPRSVASRRPRAVLLLGDCGARARCQRLPPSIDSSQAPVW